TNVVNNAISIAGFGVLEPDGLNRLGAIRFAKAATISTTITLTGDSRIGTRGSGTTVGATVAGQITGGFGLELGHSFANGGSGVGMVTLSNVTNNWTGNTSVLAGTVKVGASEVIPHGAGFGN